MSIVPLHVSKRNSRNVEFSKHLATARKKSYNLEIQFSTHGTREGGQPAATHLGLPWEPTHRNGASGGAGSRCAHLGRRRSPPSGQSSEHPKQPRVKPKGAAPQPAPSERIDSAFFCTVWFPDVRVRTGLRHGNHDHIHPFPDAGRGHFCRSRCQ